MPPVNRRAFLKVSGAIAIPSVLPLATLGSSGNERTRTPAGDPIVRFFFDGAGFDPGSTLEDLQAINTAKPIRRDFYGEGGVVADLQKKFEEITGKEKCLYLPTGTMANQLAISVLSGEKTKIFVQDTSHIYRDEADAAQSVFMKRLMPLAPGETFFTLEQLKRGIESLKELEVFPSGVGCVAIENPVRRRDGRMVPFDEMKRISDYCKTNGIGLHLDGARLFMASAWSGISISQYSSLFDTVYISLYKYLGAGSGAVLCGEKKLMDRMPHLIKIHGGTTFSAWPNAAVALEKLETIQDKLRKAIKRAEEVFAGLNRIKGITVTTLEGGTNIYPLELVKTLDGKKMRQTLNNDFHIQIPPFDESNKSEMTVNETILNREPAYIVNAFEQALKQ